MNLIMVLIALGVELRLGDFDRYRNLAWFERYAYWLESRLAGAGFWNGAGGVLVTLSIPLLLLGVLVYLAGEAHFLLGFILSLLVLIYSFGPALNSLVSRYADALSSDDDGACREILEQILYGEDAAGGTDPDRVISSIMVRAHEYLFAIVFWFVLLGAVGALMYCLVLNLAHRHENTDNGYAGAIRDLHNILMWPSARLQALGFALGGSLVSALESWRTVSGNTLDISREVIAVSGFGALHYTPAGGVDADAGVDTDAEEGAGAEEDAGADKEVFIARIRETLALINRTLIVWLIVLGLMTIAGWIS